MLKLRLFVIVALSLAMATPSAVAQQHKQTPRQHSLPAPNFTPVPHHHQADAGYLDREMAQEKECKDKPGRVLGQEGYQHCRDHPFLQQVFTTANCKCSVGECRET